MAALESVRWLSAYGTSPVGWRRRVDSGKPFNGLTFSAFALLMLLAARWLSNDPVRVSPGPVSIAGGMLIAFGWVYPHSLIIEHWVEYAYAAPLGVIPCPTLSAVTGFTLLFGLLRPITWVVTLGAAGLLYGAIGVFRLGVPLDFGLLAGTVILLSLSLARQRRSLVVGAQTTIFHGIMIVSSSWY